jgi:hypothetical protein
MSESVLSNIVVDNSGIETQLAQSEFQLLRMLGCDQDVNLPSHARHVPEVKLGASHQMVKFATEGGVQGGSAIQLVPGFKFFVDNILIFDTVILCKN